MKVIKKSVALLLAVVLSFSIVFCFSCNSVSAAVTFPLPDKIWLNPRFTSLHPNFDYETFCSDFFDYSELNPDDYFLFLAEGTAFLPSGVFIFPFEKNAVGEYTNGNHTHIYLTTYPSTIYKCNSSFGQFSSLTQSSLFGNYPRSLCYIISDQSYNFAVMKSNGQFNNVEPNTVAYCLIAETSPPPFVPSPSTLYGLDLDINETDFYNWIMENNRLTDLPNYITANKLMSFIQFYKKFGGSFTNFLKNIPSWFQYMNIVNQSSDNVNVLKSAMDKLFQEYVNSYWRAIYPDFSNIPTHRRNIRTNTTDTDTTLITDDSNDTVDTSILRDILRGIISINNSISDGFIAVINKLTGLDFTVNVANNGGSNDSDNSLSIDYTDQGNFGIDEIHQYEPLPEAPDIDGDVDFLEYPAVLAQTSTHFFNLLPNEMSALMSAVLVLGVLINKIGR